MPAHYPLESRLASVRAVRALLGEGLTVKERRKALKQIAERYAVPKAVLGRWCRDADPPLSFRQLLHGDESRERRCSPKDACKYCYPRYPPLVEELDDLSCSLWE